MVHFRLFWKNIWCSMQKQICHISKGLVIEEIDLQNLFTPQYS